MRFISKYGRPVINLRPMIAEPYASGMTKTIQTPLYAFFNPLELTADERELAIAQWGVTLNGSYQHMDEATMVQPDYRISVFDSHRGQAEQGWSEEERIFVEEGLLDYCLRFEDVIPVPAVFVEPPWPNYDDFKGTAQALVRKLVEEGHDLDDVLKYEQGVQNRPKVIEALNETINDPEARAALEPEEEQVIA